MARTQDSSITAALDLVLNQVNQWLSPTIHHQCAAPDAARLRVLLANLRQIRERIALSEGELALPERESLALACEAMADDMAGLGAANGLVALTTRQLASLVGFLNEAAAWAWALELHYAAAGPLVGVPKIPELKLARTLSKQGVTAGLPAPANEPAGGAA